MTATKLECYKVCPFANDDPETGHIQDGSRPCAQKLKESEIWCRTYVEKAIKTSPVYYGAIDYTIKDKEIIVDREGNDILSISDGITTITDQYPIP